MKITIELNNIEEAKKLEQVVFDQLETEQDFLTLQSKFQDKDQLEFLKRVHAQIQKQISN